MRRIIYVTLIVELCVLGQASGQSNIDRAHKFAWGENIGWTNWQHDRPNPGDGVLVNETFLAGFVWAENVGWINLGYGVPTDGIHYANSDDSDFGVNLDPETGDLFGLGWGENVGWVNFDTRDKGDQRARIDCSEERFYGYIWGENVGWINLDDATHFIAGVFDVSCDDSVGCTDDACVDGECVSTPNDANCPDDGSFCSGAEVCDAVEGCVSTGDPCAPGTFCNEDRDTCDECAADADCDDGLVCTVDTCDPESGLCSHEPQSCEGDANCDGTVNPLDGGYVLARFGCPVGTGDPSCDAADVNGDGAVDPLDSGFVLARFGTCR